MASRTPPHVSLVYTEETTDQSLLVERAARAAAETAPFVVSLGDVATEDGGRGGVWFSVVDSSDSWKRLRLAIESRNRSDVERAETSQHRNNRV